MTLTMLLLITAVSEDAGKEDQTTIFPRRREKDHSVEQKQGFSRKQSVAMPSRNVLCTYWYSQLSVNDTMPCSFKKTSSASGVSERAPASAQSPEASSVVNMVRYAINKTSSRLESLRKFCLPRSFKVGQE
jgi:hypothetical protein